MCITKMHNLCEGVHIQYLIQKAVGIREHLPPSPYILPPVAVAFCFFKDCARALLVCLCVCARACIISHSLCKKEKRKRERE